MLRQWIRFLLHTVTAGNRSCKEEVIRFFVDKATDGDLLEIHFSEYSKHCHKYSYQWLIVDADVCGEVPPIGQQIHNILHGSGESSIEG